MKKAKFIGSLSLELLTAGTIGAIPLTMTSCGSDVTNIKLDGGRLTYNKGERPIRGAVVGSCSNEYFISVVTTANDQKPSENNQLDFSTNGWKIELSNPTSDPNPTPSKLLAIVIFDVKDNVEYGTHNVKVWVGYSANATADASGFTWKSQTISVILADSSKSS